MSLIPLIACSTCAANFAQDPKNAAGWSIFVMLVIIVLMLGCIAICMVRLARRAQQFADPTLADDWSPDKRA